MNGLGEPNLTVQSGSSTVAENVIHEASFSIIDAMNMSKIMKFLNLAPLVILAGCVSTYNIPNDRLSANISFDLTSDSTGTTTRGFTIFAYEDLNCTPSRYGSRLDWKWPANDREFLGPTKVAAGEPLIFAVLYGESRFAQNRNCSFTASFIPLVGQTYEVRFAAINQSLACDIQIVDEIGKQVEYQVPEISCAKSHAGKVKNGGAGILNWKVQIVR